MREPNQAELAAQWAWLRILAAVEDLTVRPGADYFTEYDAKKLGNSGPDSGQTERET